MKKAVGPVVVAAVFSLCSPAFAQLDRGAAIAKAETILKSLQDGQTADVVKELDTKMAQALSEDKLKAAWPGLAGQFGAYTAYTSAAKDNIRAGRRSSSFSRSRRTRS